MMQLEKTGRTLKQKNNIERTYHKYTATYVFVELGISIVR